MFPYWGNIFSWAGSNIYYIYKFCLLDGRSEKMHCPLSQLSQIKFAHSLTFL